MKSKIVPKEAIPQLESDEVISHETNLPYPIVHYPSRFGSFFGFQETQDSPVYYCSCQKTGLEVYLMNDEFNRFSDIPKVLREQIGESFLKSIQYEENLCHVCNKVAPAFGFGKTINGTKFHAIYGLYINGVAYSYGISPFGRIRDASLIPSDIVPYLITTQYDDKRLDEQSVFDFMRYCEDSVRMRMGYFTIGKKWTTEIKLLDIVKKLYPEYTVIHQYPLDHLRADIFIEDLDLVIENQGEQHFKPIKVFGGEEALKKTKARDEEKAMLCEFYKLGIIYFTYQDDLTEKSVRERISSYMNGK
ncbi:hypothetical protein [Mesobacillus stamsii]|uniref:DUF559 domain-containing protein n=1 Tax=Mesobacillus stamsii TaxID=225347 RepID=A0ABU0FZ64_9BACI|nr:hypothetical protein [Mesobacillus stamsii]MDQ0414985.1 hypothetical protein [Mesobacillus stamsii]